MSELREEILGAGINKKRIIGIALVAIILISMFAFSVTFFSFLFGSQRPDPSRRKAETDYEDALLIKPPFPFNADWLQNLLNQFNLSDLANLNIDNQTLIDMLSDLLDGDISDLDLGNFSAGEILPLLALLGLAGAGNIEIFRVYNYDSLDDMRDVLWKFECYDEYTGDGWSSTASKDIYDFYDYGDYYSNYAPDPELLKIKKPVPTPEIGINSMVIPTLFPNPYVMEGSVNAPNLNPGSTTLYKTEYNCTIIDLYFNSEDGVNMTYEMFGLHLPTDQEINNNAIEAVYTPSYIKNKYLQLPPTINIYKSNNPYFNTHFNNLDAIINPTDNTFVVANKIKNYLNTNFDIPRSIDDYNPAPEGVDTVEWFCQTRVGVYSDFASAFCAFSRAFGVASRCVDGFNSMQIEEFFDNDEGQNTFAIKYENLYNWAEIYVPMDVSGAGKWVQFDIEPIKVLVGDYSITVTSDRFPTPSYSRSDTAIITATVSSPSDPVDGLNITFTDVTTRRDLGQDVTDINGEASILLNIDDSQVVGPHIIEAKYDDRNYNQTIIEVLGDISVLLTSINPGEINISDSQPDSTNIQGYVYDPINGERVKDAQVNLVLFQKGTNIEELNAFSPSSIITDEYGDFNEIVDLNPTVPARKYEIRADFNGTWIIYGFPYPISSISNSSNRMELNVTRELDVLFYINGTASNDPNNPVVSRYEILNLTARVYSEIQGPSPNKAVYFYDYSRGDVLIGSDLSDLNGYASINYYVGDYCVSGPNLLYAMLGPQKNYSYFILDDNSTINIISGPTPRVINRSGEGATHFNIVGEIYDSTNNSIPISYSEITLMLLKGGSDYSSYLAPSEIYPYQTDSTGTFDLTFGVASDTPPGNYTLRIDFNGTIDLSSYPYSYLFNLPILATSTYFLNDLTIEAEASFLFWINGTTTDDYNHPRINRNEDLNLTVYIHTAGNYSDPIRDGEIVEFYDVTQDNLPIGSDTTTDGYATIIYSTNFDTVAGPHLIYATWNNRENYSYFVLNDSISINLDVWPQNRIIDKYNASDTFTIQGYLNDTQNSRPIKYGVISIHLFDGGEIGGALRLVSGSYQSNQNGMLYAEFGIESFVPTGNFTLEVWFNGTFIYSSPNNLYNEHDFNLPYINSSNNADYELQVYDPNDIGIYLWIDGTPTLPTYYGGDHPERFNRGENITFTVYVRNSTFGPANFGDIRIYDIFNNSNLLATHPLDIGDGGSHDFILNTSSWHAGLHYIKVNWSSFSSFNTTYVIINETFTLSSNLDNPIILRNVDSFSVYGTLTDYGVPLRGLILNIVLLDNTYSDVSGLYLIGTNALRINNDGSFQFLNSVDLSCPQGVYWLNITFIGDIDDTGISQTGFMVHSNSLIQINVTADTYIVGNYDTKYYKDGFYYTDTLSVYGTLYWDNGTTIANSIVNVTIRDLSGAILATNTNSTDSFGFFIISFTIGLWDEDTTNVWANFYPEDTPFPDSKFIVYTEQQVFRET